MDYTNAFGRNGKGKPPEGISAFDVTVPAEEFTPIPPGIYSARVWGLPTSQISSKL